MLRADGIRTHEGLYRADNPLLPSLNLKPLGHSAAALGLCLILSACATPNCPKPAVELRTITVDRPIPVPCVRSADLPSVPARIGDQLNGDAVHDVSVLASALLRMRATAETQSALLQACAKP